MNKELYQEIVKETTLNIVQSEIDSIRRKEIVKSGCRVYQNGRIGISGIYGEPTKETWTEAEKMLKRNIPYSYSPEKNKKRTRDLRSLKITEKEFLERSEHLLEKLREKFPDFIFSNKIKLIETTYRLENDWEVSLENFDRTVEIFILTKHKASINIFDLIIGYSSRTFSVDEIVADAEKQLSVFHKAAAVPDSKMPVILFKQDMFSSFRNWFQEQLDADAIGKKISLFYEKFGKRVFHPDFSFYIDRTEQTNHNAFFDMEGSTLDQDKCYLIERGIIKHAYSDKRTSNEYALINTAAAGGEFDDVPNLKIPPFGIEQSNKTLTELLNGKSAIFAAIMNGGDSTNEGNFASPVQTAYLVKDGICVGRLPQIVVSGNQYQLFGEDYIGYTKDKPFGGEHMLVLNMDVKELK